MNANPDNEVRIVAEAGGSPAVSQGAFHAEVFFGPLPPPEMFRQYEDIMPGSAERILCMAEKEQTQRHSREDRFDARESRNSIAGIRSGFTIGVVALLAAAYCAHIGYPIPAGILGGGGIIGLAGVFVLGSRAKQVASLPTLPNDELS